MKPLTKAEKAELKKLIDAGDPLSENWLSRLFPARSKPQIGKEYQLVYDGKMTREEVLAETPAAPWQLVRSFCDDRPHEDGWQNLLVWGDNLMAMRELLADQRGPNLYRTRDKIKLVYIDPPFATRKDFMKDREKAYQDKVLGSRFIEFLRRRIVLLRELLADDGVLFLHLDAKKHHYMKAVLDELFGEHNLINDITWKRSHAHGDTGQGAKHFGPVTEKILLYAKSETFRWVPQYQPYSREIKARDYKYVDETTGERYRLMPVDGPGGGAKGNPYYEFLGVKGYWRYSKETMQDLYDKGEIALSSTGRSLSRIRFIKDAKGTPITDLWDDIGRISPTSSERVDYPTQKPEALLERILSTCTKKGDIVFDCFAGSGTTPAVSEKMGRKWIAMDCGKLAIYTTQKRLFSLSTQVGSAKKDERSSTGRVDDWSEHEKKARGVFFITEKARKGECEVTLDLLKDLAVLARKHQLVRADSPLSIVCPEKKLRIKSDRFFEPANAPGTKGIEVGGIEFRVSYIEPKDQIEKEKALPAKQFALYRAGVYDMQQIHALSWDSYRPLVMKLFGVRDAPHKRYGFPMDGYVRSDSAVVWNYPDHLSLSLDRQYVEDLHKMVRGKNGERIYVIVPVVAMAFMEDEVTVGKTTYVFLKVPVSVLMRLIEHGAPAALPQPMKEDDVNDVIDAVGFDFVSQPLVEWSVRKSNATDGLFSSFIIEIRQFRAQTLATDPEDFANFETLSMVMLDFNYDDDVFRLSEVHWGEDLVKDAGGLDEAKKLTISIPEADFVGDRLMMILCDRYGNEKTLAIEKSDFRARKKKKASKAKSAKKRAPKRKTAGGSR